MADNREHKLLQAVSRGDEKAFESLYDRFNQRVRLVAWRITHRTDWIDDLTNEAWCRAFSQRTSYNPNIPFLIWMTGILRNVYREFCRKSPQTTDPRIHTASTATGITDDLSPETIAHEAEVLAALDDCLEQLPASDATIIRLRFFQGKTLRYISQELSIPESTLRESRLPVLFKQLRQCLDRKKIDYSGIFSAQGPGEMQ